MARLVVIDNYDSFTYNLVQMFRCFEPEILVFRSDAVSVADVKRLAPDFILISPGPKDPDHAGISKKLIKEMYKCTPILGVCLGMQCMNEVFGGETVRAPVPVHGKTSVVRHEGAGIFSGIPSSFKAARYHSLMVKLPAPPELLVTAVSDDGVIMGISHSEYPLHGVQFHPESFMTEFGLSIAKNFLQSGSDITEPCRIYPHFSRVGFDPAVENVYST